MAKRFIDITILPKNFRKLELSLKLTWFYLWNHCDKAGVYEIDEDLFAFENGFDIDIESIMDNFSDLVEFSGEKILLKDFIKINYGTLTENYNPHKPVFRAIEENNIKLISSLNQACFKLVDEEEKEDEYKDKVLKEKKELEKVVEIYNSVSDKLPKVQAVTAKRIAAVKARLKEHGFSKVNEVLVSIPKSSFLTGENDRGWKADFDWVMNPTNFAKVMEGKYTDTVKPQLTGGVKPLKFSINR